MENSGSPGQIFADVDTLKTGLQAAFTAVLSGVHDARAQILAICDAIAAQVVWDADAVLALIHSQPLLPYNVSHALYSGLLSEILAKRLGADTPTRRSIVAAALTCNIAALPYQERLRQQRSPLSREQLMVVQRHPDQGVALLRGIGVASPTWLAIVKQHHERIDGSGYPEGLRGSAILREAKLVALTDAYLAQVTDRAYRETSPAREALRNLFLQGQQDDPELYAAFVKELGIYPPGTWVRLACGEVGIVVRRRENAKAPAVRAILASDGRTLNEAPWRDTTMSGWRITDTLAARPELLPEPTVLWRSGGDTLAASSF